MQRSYNRYSFQQIAGTIDPVLSKTKISKKQSDKSYNYNNYNNYIASDETAERDDHPGQ